MRKFQLSALAMLMALSLACNKSRDPVSTTAGQAADSTDTGNGNTEIITAPGTVSKAMELNCGNHEDAEDYAWNSLQVVQIDLNGTSMTANNAGVTLDDGRATLTSAGTYRFSGALSDGQIIVDTDDKGVVRLILSGASITCASSAPIYVKNAKKTVIVLEDGTENNIQDGTAYTYENEGDDEPNAAIFSKSDLTICGNGSLTVKGQFNDGISSKDGLVIRSGRITVQSADDGIRGKDYLIVRNGNITVNSGGDALKSDNAEDPARGYILIESGRFNLTAAGDAIAAETDALTVDGEITLISGGGKGHAVAADASAKGIKGNVSTIIDNGTFTINSADDAVHSNSMVEINGGSFAITTGDDAVHADTALTINGGSLRIASCYEGIESRAITINNGNIRLNASDDGFNAAAGGGNGGMGGGPGGPGWQPGGGGFPAAGNFTLTINGGNIVITAVGDGVDINGSIVMTGGSILINGPTANMNGAVDYDATFKMTGGFLLAAGSSGMAQAPGTGSTQYSLLLNFTSPLAPGTLCHIQNSAGDDMLTFAPAKIYQSISFCSSRLKRGVTYSVYTGGSSTGTVTDGLYEGGTYNPGSKFTDFTVSGIVTKINSR
jgi:hypothetical protein